VEASYTDTEGRPSDEMFLRWARDGNADLLSDALQKYPDLVDTRDKEVGVVVL